MSSPVPRRSADTLPKAGVAVDVPASGENTVAPNSPTPTALVGPANVAAKIGRGDGSTALTVVPPLVVRSSLSPLSVEIRQTSALAHRTRVSLPPAASGGTVTGFHVSPPSVDLRIVLLSPTA